MPLLPEHTTPKDLARHLGASPRGVEDLVREIGCYRKIGATVIMLAEDVDTFMEATKPCRSNSTNAGKSGTSGALLPDGDFAALQARLTKKSPNASQRKPKPKRGEIVSMDRGRM